MRSKLIPTLATLLLLTGASMSLFTAQAAPPASLPSSAPSQHHPRPSGVTQFTHADATGALAMATRSVQSSTTLE